MYYTFKPEYSAHDSQPPRPALETLHTIGEILAGPSGSGDKCLAALKELSHVIEADSVSLRAVPGNQTDFVGIRLSPNAQPGGDSGLVGLARQAVEQKRTVVCDKGLASLTPGFNGDSHEMESGAAHPVMVGGEVIGVIEATSRHRDHFTSDRLKLLATVSNNLGPVAHESFLDQKSGEAVQHQLTQENHALAEIGRIINTSLHIDEIFEKFASEMKKLVAFDRATLNDVDEAAGKYTLKYVSGLDVPGQAIGRVGELEGTLTQFLIGSEKALARPDIAEDKRFADDQRNLDAGFRSGIAVPLNSQGRTIASLSLLSRETNAFGRREASILERLANQISPALENARLYEDSQQQAREIQVVADLAKIISSNVDIRQVYGRFASEVKQLLDLEWVGITIVDEASQTMHLDYLSRTDGAHFNLGESLPLADTLSAEAIRTRRSVVVGDLTKDSPYWTAKFLVEDGLRSCITIPLFSNEKIIGTMVVLSGKANAYGPREQMLLERLALQIGPTVENSILFQEVDQHALALASIGDGVTFLDTNGTFQFVNRAFEEMYGLEAGEVIGRSFDALVAAGDTASLDKAKMIFQKGLEQGWSGELARQRFDGEPFYMHLTITPVRDRSGRVIGEIGVSRDITSQKSAEEELLLRNQELETLVHIASLLVRDVPFQEKCEDVLEALAVSVQAEMVTLRTPDDETGGLRLISQAGPANWEQQEVIPRRTTSGETLASGLPMVVNNYLESPLALAKEIERGINSMVSLPIIGGTDQILGVVNLISQEVDHFTAERIRFLTTIGGGIGSLLENARLYQQISLELEQRQRAENALRESEARFRQLYDDAPVGYHEMDRDGCLNRVNRTELDMLGFSEEEMLGKPVWDFFVESDISKTSFEAKIAGKMAPGRGYERTFLCKNGETLSALIEDRTLYDDTGEIVGFRSTIQDITERKFAEEKLRETSRLVSIGELAAGVAHEINNPLTVVTGFSELLASGDLPEPAGGYARMVHTEVQRATKVVQNLLSFARRHDQEMRYSDVRKVLDRALDLKAYDFKNSNIEIVSDIPSKLPRTMLDEHQLLQVFTNLFTNAEQAMGNDSGGRIKIHIAKRKHRIRISVSDSGPGIPADVLPKIFDPFYTTKEVGSGTGLGLSICYGIVGQHGGDMWAESLPGKGATFYLELPILGGEPDEDRPAVNLNASMVAPKRILAVDDEPGIRDLVQKILTADGHQVEVASNAAAARKLVEQGGFDLLLLDLWMPGGGGRELYEWILKHDWQLATKAIFVTGDTAREDTRRFLEAAGRPVINKPFHLDELRLAMKGLFPLDK